MKIRRRLRKIKEFLVWMLSRRVLEAINEGATYEEVCAIVQAECDRR